MAPAQIVPRYLRYDLLRGWAERHRARFADIRLRAWGSPLPEIRHFK
jgi:hypothetical protein